MLERTVLAMFSKNATSADYPARVVIKTTPVNTLYHLCKRHTQRNNSHCNT